MVAVPSRIASARPAGRPDAVGVELHGVAAAALGGRADGRRSPRSRCRCDLPSVGDARDTRAATVHRARRVAWSSLGHTGAVPTPTRATYVRRRAAAGLLAVVIIASVVVLSRGSGDPARQGSGATARPATPASAPPRPRTDVTAIAARSHVPVLCYHQIRPLPAADATRDRLYIVPPRTLDAQLATLQRAGYRSVSADDVAAHLGDGKPLPRKPVLITFDDASADQYTRALPILRRHGFKATFFVMTVALGKPGWLTRGQVRALDRDGMEVAAHTWDHQAVPDYAGSDWRVQVTDPKAALERIVGHSLDAFAYPFGLWNARAFSHLRGAGFKIAFQLSDKIDRTAPMLTVRRVLIGPDVSGDELLRIVREDF